MIYKLSSEYFVRPLLLEDVDGPYPLWFENQEVCKYNSHGKFFKSKKYFQDFFMSLDGQDKIVWAICHHVDGHIGNISLQDISLINRNAEFAILLGDARHHGKGVSKLAGQKIIDHGFNKINLERIYCGTASTNLAMNRLALSLGMIKEGVRRSHLYLDGHWLDVVEYGLLRSETVLEKSGLE